MKRKRILALALAAFMSVSPIMTYASNVPSAKAETDAVADRFLLNHQEISIDLENSYPLPLYLTTGYYTESSDTKEITWKSNKENIATVDEEGRITAKAPGEAIITATHKGFSGKTAECKVKVYKNEACNTFYYVSEKGSDSNTGTEEKPFKTIGKARDTIRGLKELPVGGITVILEDGKYYEEETIVLTPEDSGTEEKPIIYKARNEGKAIITGEVPITDWEKAVDVEGMDEAAQGKVYVADVEEGWRFHDLYVNGERQQISRSFNTDNWREWPIFYGRAPLSYDEEKGARVVFGEGELDGLEGNDDVELILLPVMYWNSIPLVKHIDAKNRTAYLQSQIPSNFWPDHFGTNEGFYNIINTIKYLDQPGEWCIDSQAGKVYYWPQNEDSFATDEIVAPKPYEVLRLQGDGVDENFENLVEYVTFDGIVFQYTDRLPENEFPEDWIIRNAENPDAAVYFDGTRNCRLINSEIRHSGSYGVTVNHYGQNNEILHNQMHDLGSGGVQLYGYGVGTVDVNHNNIVMYNSIYNMGVAPYQHAPGLGVFGSGSNTMAFNYIAGAPYAGISIVGTDENSVSSEKPDTRAAYDLFGNQSSQYGIRFEDLEALPETEKDGTNGEYFKIGTLAEKYQHSERNVAEYNYLEDYSQSMDDGGALYSWYSGLGNVYANNVLKEELTGSRTWVFWMYMDDRAIGYTLKKNLATVNFNGTVDKSFNPYGNRYIDNAYKTFPEVPAGYNEQKAKLLDAVEKQYGGFKLSEKKKPEITSPKAGSEDVKIPTAIVYNQCENASMYKVEIATDQAFKTIVESIETQASIVTTDKLDFETQYYARVTTREYLSEPQVSDVVSFKTAKLTAPEEVLRETKLTNDIDAVLVQWKPVVKNQVNVYRKAEGESDYTLIAENIDGSGYLDSQIQANTTYSYQVAGVNKSGEGPRSKEMSIHTRELNVLFTDDFNDGTISDQWTDISGNQVNLNPADAKVVEGQWEPAGDWREYFVGLNEDEETWDDYAVEADITFKGLQPGAQSYSGFGLITRASGTSGATKKFYQFLIRTNADKQMELQSCINNVWKNIVTVKMDDKPEDGSLYRMRAESVGNSLRIYLNGILFADVEDDDLLNGGIGFGYGKDYISVDNVRVSQPKQYQIDVDDTIKNGTIETSRNQAAQGSSVVLTMKPDKGYELKPGSLKMNGQPLNSTVFTMPKEDVVITAEFEKAYDVTVDSKIKNGKVTADVKKAVESQEVTLTVTPDTGYELVEGSLKVNNGAVKVTDNRFSMPGKDVVITAEFEKVYDVTVDSKIKNGKITTDVKKAAENREVTLTVIPDTGYELVEGSLKVNNGAVKVTDNRFNMPGENVVVTAEFKTSITRLLDSAVNTVAGTAPTLPKTVKAEYLDGTSKDVAVNWNKVDVSYYAKAGSFVVEGAVEGTSLKAKCKVTVTEETHPGSYTITYKLNGGKNNKKNVSAYNGKKKVTLYKPTKRGYEFIGWYQDSKFKTKVTSIAQGSNKNYTLYAKWKKVSVGKPASLTVKSKKSKTLNVSYKAVKGAKKYQITYSTSSKFTKKTTKSVNTSKTKYTLKKLKKNKKYNVKVRAYKIDSAGKKVYGKYASVKKVKTK